MTGGGEATGRAVLEALGRAGFEEAEVYLKRGRSRRVVHGPGVRAATFHEERGWAVRAATRRASMFASGTGSPTPDHPWPEPDGHPLRLPDPDVAGGGAPWNEPPDFESSLLGEGEALRLVEGVEERLAREVPGARLVAAVLEDGSSESEIANRRGVAARWRSRVALLHLEANRDGASAAVDLAEREARRFNPRAVAQRLADRLTIAGAGAPAELPGRDRAPLILAPPLAARLLAALRPYLVGARAADRAAPLRDRRGRVASAAVTLIDDGRFPGGLLEAPVDGEGVPTREVVLVEAGVYRQPLLAWHEARPAEARASGCSRRASWRDLPAAGPTHLYLAPRRGAAVGDLLAEVARGYYLLDAAGPVSLDEETATLEVPVCGFTLQSGAAVAPVGSLVLSTGVGTLLHGVQAVARDLTFFPWDGMIGSPTVLVTGVELRG